MGCRLLLSVEFRYLLLAAAFGSALVRTSPSTTDPMPKTCQGRDAGKCSFGKEGKPLQVGGADSQCVWCSKDRMAQACRDSKIGRHNLVKSFKQMTRAQQERAFKRVPEAFQTTFRALMDRMPRCEGRPGEPCEFHEGNTGEAAHGKRGCKQCVWCNEERLAAACRTDAARKKLASQLRHFRPAARDKIITQRIPQEHRDFFKVQCAEPTRRGGKRRATRCQAGEGREPEEEEKLDNAAAETWPELLAKRASHRAPPAEEQLATYRKRKLDDRARVRRCFQLEGRAQRGAEVDNSTGLPPPKRSKLAKDLWRWCTERSWKVCQACGGMEPADLTQKALEAEAADPTVAKCKRCKAKVACEAPAPEDVPEELRSLEDESAAALAHLEIDVGPMVRARNQGGQVSGYPQHSAITRFFWKERTAKENIEEIRDREQRRKAKAARRYLLNKHGCSYGKFEKAHKQFLKEYPQAGGRQRRRRLKFIEAPGIETAVWPHLFYDDAMCLTVARATDARRLGRANGPTLEDFMDGNVSLDEGDEAGEEEGDLARHSVKRAYAALALASRIGYGSSYKILHFAYDLSLWSALGAKKKTSMEYDLPMRVLMKGHPFSPLFWQAVHWGLIDMVRQMGYPKIFWTISPYEMSMPYHQWMLDEMAKELQGRMDLPVAETLHITHVLLEVVRGGRVYLNLARPPIQCVYMKHVFPCRSP